MKAQYIGTQPTKKRSKYTGEISYQNLILVKVKYPWGINTEVYEPLKHELSDKDIERIREDLK